MGKGLDGDHLVSYGVYQLLNGEVVHATCNRNDCELI